MDALVRKNRDGMKKTRGLSLSRKFQIINRMGWGRKNSEKEEYEISSLFPSSALWRSELLCGMLEDDCSISLSSKQMRGNT